MFDYCINVWGHCAHVYVSKLQVLQNRAARIILHADWNASSDALLKELHWMNVNDRLFYCTCVLMFKVMNGYAPTYLNTFETRSLPYGLRNSSNISLPQPRTDMYKSCFSYYGVSCWNKLPENVKSSQNISSFKRKLKQTILS